MHTCAHTHIMFLPSHALGVLLFINSLTKFWGLHSVFHVVCQLLGMVNYKNTVSNSSSSKANISSEEAGALSF